MEKKQEICFFLLISCFWEARNVERIKVQGHEGNVAVGGSQVAGLFICNKNYDLVKGWNKGI